jgi:hypothetical protein
MAVLFSESQGSTARSTAFVSTSSHTLAASDNSDVADGMFEVENVDNLVQSAIREADATDRAKNMLLELIRHSSSDEVLHAYYKEMVVSKC